jgi:recombination protein U
MRNLGKVFEDNWRRSVPDYIFYYKFRDSASSYYGGNQGLRFSASNIADCLIYDNNTLNLCELKNHKGKSIPLSCIVGNKTKQKQIEDLCKANRFLGVRCYLIMFFCDVERCFSLDIDLLKMFIEEEDRKSIPLSYFEEFGDEIFVEKLKTNHRFDIKNWLFEQHKKEMN